MTLHLGDAGILVPGRWRWARALGWMAALLVGIVFVMALPAAVRAVFHPAKPILAAASFVAVVIAYVGYAVLVRRAERRAPDEVALSALPRDLVIGLAIGLGMFTLVFASLRLIGVYTLTPGLWDDWFHDIREAIGVGLIEELIFRLVIFRLLMRVTGPWWALALSAAIFGGLHLANPNATIFAAAAIAVEAGLMLAAFYLLTGRIWMSVGVHAAWNFTQGAIFGARVSGGSDTGSLFVSAPVNGASDLLSGGAFGPEASLSAIVVGATIFIIVTTVAYRRGTFPT